MHLILHAGAHCTDEDLLLRTLLKNASGLRDRGVAVPRPARYRVPLGEAMHALTGAQPAPDATARFLETVLSEEGSATDRLILSNDNFFTVPKAALGNGVIFPRAAARMRNLCKLFRDCEITVYLGLRNPATWLPAVFRSTPHAAFVDFLNGCRPRDLRWSELVHRLREHGPGIRIVTWCNEDTPLIWGALAREMLGLAPGTKIRGAFDLLETIMTDEGMRRFRAYLKSHPDLTEPQKRRVMVAFLDKFAQPDAIEEEIDVPGWTADFVEDLTRAYDDDMRQIARIPGVTMLAP